MVPLQAGREEFGATVKWDDRAGFADHAEGCDLLNFNAGAANR